MSAPLTGEQLAEIDTRIEEIGSRLCSANGIALDEAVARWYRQDVPFLLAEVDRLRTTLRDPAPTCPECGGHGTRVRRDGLAVRCVECAEVEG